MDQDLPLEKFTLFRTKSFEKAKQAMAVWRPHHMECLDGSTSIDFRLHGVSLGWMAAAFVTFGAAVHSDVGRFGLYAVVIPVSGHCEIQSGNRLVTASPECAAVLSTQEHLRVSWSRDCAVLIFPFDPPGLEGHAAEMINAPLEEPLLFDLAMDTRAGDGRYLRHEVFQPVVDELNRTDRAYNDMIVDPLQFRVMTELLMRQPNNYSAQIASLRG